ncbi:OB-fold nucleic acid binding domain protein [uncultured archaeon]|nr:OB-fold nucleic acid binding domain protein [uncultured archaeon]
MPEEQFKRNIAFKLRVGEILGGKPYLENEKFTFLELGNRKIVRVNVIGNITDKYESNGERKFLFITLDDGSGQIKLKTFGDDCAKFAELMQGETVVVIGTLRYFNNEIYIAPEIVKEQDPRYLLIRKLELEKEKAQNTDPVKVSKEQIIAVKDRILENIKNSEDIGGVSIEQLIMKLNDISPEIINQEIKKFIEEGIVFEPRPGKVRYLG